MNGFLLRTSARDFTSTAAFVPFIPAVRMLMTLSKPTFKSELVSDAQSLVRDVTVSCFPEGRLGDITKLHN
jgi:hypothetical protein